MSRHVPGHPTQPGEPVPAERLEPLVAAQPLVLVVGAAGPGRSAVLAVLAGPSAGGTMIDLGALWMAVDPPGDRPRTVRLNGAPSAAARRGWEGIAGAIGAVAIPPAVVLVDTFQGLVLALGAAGAAQTVTALMAPGRTVVVVVDDPAEVEQLGPVVGEHGVVVSVEGPSIVEVSPATSLGPAVVAEPPHEPVPEPVGEPAPERRWRWWRRSAPAEEVEPQVTGPVGSPLEEPIEPIQPPSSGVAALPAPGVVTAVTVTDANGTSVGRALVPGSYYLIRLRMKTPPGAPEPPGPGSGAWVEVGVIAEAVAVPVGPHAMFVPRRGAAWACSCQPGGPHTCLAEERTETLDLPFVAPRRPDVYRVHVAVRYRGSVIHQTRLELPVAVDGVGPAPTATVTYQLT